MKYTIPLNSIAACDRESVGDKAGALSILSRKGIRVPVSLCITTHAYRTYVQDTGLQERILMELNRKDFHSLQWEEMWDISLRIRSMFLNTPMPESLRSELKDPLTETFSNGPVAVRSSVSGEKSVWEGEASLHETYTDVRGVYAVLDQIRLVWASLWTDGALLYCRNSDLAPETRSMAVLVQEMIPGNISGLVFSRNPANENQILIECLQGSGYVPVRERPKLDRWILDKFTGRVISYPPAAREITPDDEDAAAGPGFSVCDSGCESSLSREHLTEIHELAIMTEDLFKVAHEIEWTFRNGDLYILQSYPISGRGEIGAESGYPLFFLHRDSIENLQILKQAAEERVIPDIIRAADTFSRRNLTDLSDQELAEEIKERLLALHTWEDTSLRHFLPLVHGMMTLSRLYNDALRPVDPMEFTDLLSLSDLAGIRRNRMLEQMADIVRRDRRLQKFLQRKGSLVNSRSFSRLLREFTTRFKSPLPPVLDRNSIMRLVLELVKKSSGLEKRNGIYMDRLTLDFFSYLTSEKKESAEKTLGIARAGLRLKEENEIHIDRLKKQLEAALDEGRARVAARGFGNAHAYDIMSALKNPDYLIDRAGSESPSGTGEGRVMVRQLTGCPGGRGMATGDARVVHDERDVMDFRAGEILVSEALELSVTLTVPLAGAVVVEKGGMLAHGAVIAREYNLPCLTGVSDATRLIRTGDRLTVDGYMGVVIIDSPMNRGKGEKRKNL